MSVHANFVGVACPESQRVGDDVRIDGDGLLRRYSMEIAEDTGGSASFVFDLFDYGADISIEAPPADEIIPADQFDLDSFGF